MVLEHVGDGTGYHPDRLSGVPLYLARTTWRGARTNLVVHDGLVSSL